MGWVARLAIGGWRMTNDAAYYSRRAREERAAALKAPHPNARLVHLEMAEAYELRLREAAAESRRPAIHLVSAA